MANIKSAVKRISVNRNKQAQNKPVKTALATEIKKFRSAVEGKEFAYAEERLKEVFSALDSAVDSGVIHRNKADRQKSKLAKSLHDAQTSGGAKPATAAKKAPAKKAGTATKKPAAKKAPAKKK